MHGDGSDSPEPAAVPDVEDDGLNSEEKYLRTRARLFAAESELTDLRRQVRELATAAAGAEQAAAVPSASRQPGGRRLSHSVGSLPLPSSTGFKEMASVPEAEPFANLPQAIDNVRAELESVGLLLEDVRSREVAILTEGERATLRADLAMGYAELEVARAAMIESSLLPAHAKVLGMDPVLSAEYQAVNRAVQECVVALDKYERAAAAEARRELEEYRARMATLREALGLGPESPSLPVGAKTPILSPLVIKQAQPAETSGERPEPWTPVGNGDSASSSLKVAELTRVLEQFKAQRRSGGGISSFIGTAVLLVLLAFFAFASLDYHCLHPETASEASPLCDVAVPAYDGLRSAWSSAAEHVVVSVFPPASRGLAYGAAIVSDSLRGVGDAVQRGARELQRERARRELEARERRAREEAETLEREREQAARALREEADRAARAQREEDERVAREEAAAAAAAAAERERRASEEAVARQLEHEARVQHEAERARADAAAAADEELESAGEPAAELMFEADELERELARRLVDEVASSVTSSAAAVEEALHHEDVHVQDEPVYVPSGEVPEEAEGTTSGDAMAEEYVEQEVVDAEVVMPEDAVVSGGSVAADAADSSEAAEAANTPTARAAENDEQPGETDDAVLSSVPEEQVTTGDDDTDSADVPEPAEQDEIEDEFFLP
ncbi:hypothetical protein HK405_006581 [Cladochytrium tenue]|nr:hypothetical protein HK405_006581 [Cladochytrium tenue]